MKGYAARTVYGQIYKNGSAHGSERNLFNDTNYTTYSEDLVFADGDLIQLYYKADSASEVYIKNFRLYFTKGFETTLYTVNTD